MLVLLLAVSAHALGAEWNRTELMALLAAAKSSEQRYTEIRQLAFIEIEIVSQGRLLFSPPDRLVKQVDQPDSIRYEISGDTMTISRPGEAEQMIRVDAHPLLGLWVDTLRAVLMGDITLLEQHYAVELTGRRTAWQLHLSPRDSQLAVLVDALIISGRNGDIEQIVTQERSGDQTALTLHKGSE